MSAAMLCPRAVTGAMSPYPTVVRVTMAQYTDEGMLVKPLSAPPSMRYMSVPNITQRMRTNEMKTAIFALLAFKAALKLLDSPMNRPSFKILKTLNNLSALKVISVCDPVKMVERYKGMVDKKSIIP